MFDYEVFSVRAMRYIASNMDVAQVLSADGSTRLGEVVARAADEARFWTTRDDTVKARKIVLRSTTSIRALSPARLRAVVERILNLAERASAPPIRVPETWHAWNAQDQGLISYYAASKGRIPGNPRIVAKLFLQDKDIVVWDLREDDDSTRSRLHDIEVDMGEYYRLVSRWPEAVVSSESIWKASSDSAEFIIDLELPDRTGREVPVRYSEWLTGDNLTDQQRAFVLSDAVSSIRLKGAAGTGKTLALELKAIREATKAGDEKDNPRLLFATHSWSMTEQVQEDIARLDDVGAAQFITVLPLLEVVRELRPPPTNLQVLGADSEDGREYQEMIVGMVISDFVDSDWITYRPRCSTQFVNMFESVSNDTSSVSLFRSDLVNEFSVVIGGEGIQDGPRDEARYLEMHRSPWAMELELEGDRRAVYAMYCSFLAMCRESRQLTSDQYMTTALHWFRDFEWGALRSQYGYDMAFVDELHLFNPQERGILNYLGANPRMYPRLYMSLDPVQSTTGRFGGLAADKAFEGEQQSVELREIHRFSPEILALVQHVNLSVPTEDFGDVWGVDLGVATSRAPHGPKPKLLDSAAHGSEVNRSMKEAVEAVERVSRVALAIVDVRRASEFFEAAEALQERSGRRVAIIRSRDDLGVLNYSARGLVVGTAADLAGLQFSEVIVAGLGEPEEFEPVEHRRLAFLSSLYLAVSRASNSVVIISDTSSSGLPNVLQSALKAGLIASG